MVGALQHSCRSRHRVGGAFVCWRSSCMCFPTAASLGHSQLFTSCWMKSRHKGDHSKSPLLSVNYRYGESSLTVTRDVNADLFVSLLKCWCVMFRKIWTCTWKLFRQTLDGINNQYSWLQRASGAMDSMCDYRWEGSWFDSWRPHSLSLWVAQGALCICSFYYIHFSLVLLLWERLKHPVFLRMISQALLHSRLPHPAEDVPWFPPDMTPAIKTNYSSLMSAIKPILLECSSDSWDFLPRRIFGDQLEGPSRPSSPNCVDCPVIVRNSSKRCALGTFGPTEPFCQTYRLVCFQLMPDPLKWPVPLNSSNLDCSSLIQSQIWNTTHTWNALFLVEPRMDTCTHTRTLRMCGWMADASMNPVHFFMKLIREWHDGYSSEVMDQSLSIHLHNSPNFAFYSLRVPCMSRFDPECAASLAHLCLDPVAALLATWIEI